MEDKNKYTKKNSITEEAMRESRMYDKGYKKGMEDMLDKMNEECKEVSSMEDLERSKNNLIEGISKVLKVDKLLGWINRRMGQ